MNESDLLSEAQLVALAGALEGDMVLSVYLEQPVSDPAGRDAWQATILNALAPVRASLAEQSRNERDEFERSVALLGDVVSDGSPAVHACGWFGFITSDQVRFAGALPAPTPTLVRWQRGVWATPCIRALKQHRVVIVAIADGVSARLFRYVAGSLLPAGKVAVHVRGGHADHLGALPRAGFHPGTRGTPATDLAAKARVTARGRLVHAAASQILALAGESGYVILGGTTPAAHALLRELSPSLARHTLCLAALTARTPDAAIRDLAAQGASALRDADDRAMVDQLIEAVGAHGAAVAGAVAVLDAASAGRAHEVLLTERFVNAEPELAEQAVKFALAHHTRLEIVMGEAAARLDREAGGIAAHLRFVRQPADPLAVAS